MKKLTKQMVNLIDEANYYFKANKVTSIGDPLFLILTNNMIHQDVFYGWGYRKTIEIDGQTVDVSATESDKEFICIFGGNN